MGLFDDLLDEDELTQKPIQPQIKNRKVGLFDDLLEEEKEIGTLEGISNAAKNAFDSSRQAMDVVGGVTPEEAKNIAKIEFDKKSRKVAPGYDEYQKAEGMDAVWAFAKNPIEVTSNIIAEGLAGSLPALGAGLAAGGVGAAAGSVIPVLGTAAGFTAGQVAGTFAGSLATEYGGKVLEELQGEGMDISDPNSIQTFFGNEELVGKARDKALKRGVPIAAFDAVSAGIGGKLGRVFGTKVITEGEKIIGKQFATKAGEAATELGVQAALGGGGEVAGAIAAGEPIEGKAVFGEVIGEVGPGAAEVITGRIADKRAMAKAQEDAKIKAASDLSTILEENNAPLTAKVVTAKSATNIEQDKLAAQLEEELSLAAIKPTATAPAKVPTKEDYVARYSAIAETSPEELTRAEQSFTSELSTADTEEKRINAQNALDAIKEVKASVTAVTPTITPPVVTQPAAVAAQPPTIDATQEIIQPEGVRQEPQDRTQVQPPEEAGVSDSLFGAARGEEEGQIDPIVSGLQAVANNTATNEQIASLSMFGLVDIRRGQAIINEDGEGILAQAQAALPKLTPKERAAEIEAAPVEPAPIAITEEAVSPTQPTISEIPPTSELVGAEPTQPIISEKPKTSELVGAEPTQPTIREVTEISPIVGAEPAAIVEQEPVAPAEPKGTRVAAAAYIAPDGTEYTGPSHLAAMEQAKNEGKITQTEIDAKQAPESRETPQFGYKTDSEPFVTRDQAEGIARQSGQLLVEKPATGQLHSNEVALDEFPKEAAVATAPAEEVTPTVSEVSNIPKLESEYNAAKAKLDALGPEPIKPSSEARFFGARGRAGSPTELVAKYDADVKAYNSYRRKYSSAKRAEVEAANNLFYARREAAAAPTPSPTPVTTPPVTEAVTPAAEQPAASIPASGKPFEFFSIRNKEKAPSLGTQFGQDVEPSGKYISQSTPDAAKNLDARFEKKAVRFENPLVVEFGGEYGTPTNWKNVLSSQYGGKTGKELSQAIRDAGYDGIVTVEPAKGPNRPASTSEIVDISSLKPKKQVAVTAAVTPAQAATTPAAPEAAPATQESFGQRMLNAVNEKIAQGKDVFISTMTKSTKVNKKAVDNWNKAGKPLFKVGKDGNLYIGSGKRYDQLTAADMSLVGFSSEGKKLAVAEPAPQPAPPAPEPAAEPAGISVGNRIKLGKSPQTYTIEEVLPQSATERDLGEQYYSVKNERTGEVQTVEKADLKPVGGKKARKATAAEIRVEEQAQPVPETERYTFEEAVKEVDAYFGKQGVPEGVVIVNNTTEPDLEMKAGYFVDRGQIVLNLAYISRGENIGDIISHELGHYIFSDPAFQANFQSFWDAMSPEEQAEADTLINQFYNKETGAVQIEEKQVRAFLQLIQDANALPKWKQILDAIKRWINEKLGTNLQVTDRNALAVLAVAHKRFKSGERIIREIDSGVLKAAETAQDADYLAAVERGDMETAQRMVDEAAKKAGYDSPLVFHGSSDKPFNIFKTKRGRGGTREGGAFFTPTETLANYFANIAQQVKYGGLTDKPGIIYRAYLKIDKPLTIDENFESEGTIEDKNINRIKAAKKFGFDGIIWKNTIEPFHPDGVDQYIVFNPEQIKSADPVTYDDAGDVIPLSQRFRPTSPDIRRMAAELRREQVGGMDIGRAITTPPGITKLTQNVIKENFFDSSIISEENTKQAFSYIQQFLDKTDNNGNKLAGLVNNIVDDVLVNQTQSMVDSGEFTRDQVDFEKRMGASLLRVELMNYASRLATQGDVRMFRLLRKNINRMPSDEFAGGLSAEGRSLNTAKGYNISGYGAFEIEQDSNVDRLAAALFGTSNPTKEQKDIAQQALEDSEDVEYDSAENIASSIEEIEKRTKRNIVKRIEGQISGNIEEKRKASLEKQKTRPSIPFGVERQAISVIDQFARMQSDTPAFTEKQENQVKSIVQQDLRQRPDMKRKQPWTSQLTAKLIQAGVSEAQAITISDLVWRQHEIKAMDRELKELQTAAEKGSLAVIIQRIKDTPLEEQQKPEWMQGVIREYLVEAGLSEKAADTAARLYESVIAERFAEAKQKAFEDTLSKSAPWNNYLSRNIQLGKNALKKVQDAIRVGVLDPTQTTESIIAKENGWSGFSKEQLTRIVQLDDIISNEESDQVTKAEAMSELNSIIVKAKMPVRFKDAISSYYVGQALMGIPTFTVNIASPTFFAIRNLSIDIAKYAVTDPRNIPAAFQSFINSFQSLYDNAIYAFKNQIYMSGEIEYMQGQNVLSELFDKGKAQWAKGDYANGMGNMLVGASQITGRILSALDQGAIEMMQSQNLTRYVLESMSGNKRITKDKRNEIVNIAISGRRKIKEDLIASGMAPERAGVLAELKVRSELMISLAEVGIKSTQVLDASLNDALQSVGRNRVITIKSLKKENKNLRDAGILSGIPIGFLEGVAQWANKGNQSQQVFAKMVYGFALVPARVFSTALWFSPIGFVRLGVDAALKRKGFESRYAVSLATEFQQKQRLIEAIAGTVFLAGLGSLLSSSTDDEDDELFKIVVTGNGPDYNTDRQYHDSWHKKYKPHTAHIIFGKTIIPINIGRGGEAISIPLIFLGAQDDARIKEKLNQSRKSPADLEMAAEMIGSAFYSFSQRGPFAAFTKPLFDAKKQDKVVPELFSQIGYFGKTFVPILGTSLARNVSDFINDPIDKSSVQGAIYSNMPIIGPALGTKALNAFGQPIRADDFGDRLFRLGLPVAMSFPKNTPENELNELVLKKGDGPPIPTRTNAQKKFEEPLTDKEFEVYVREYGRVVSDKMFKNRKRLENMDVKNYTKELDKYVNGYSIDGIKIRGATDAAVLAVKKLRQ